MAALSAVLLRMESGIWFFTKRLGRGRVDCCSGCWFPAATAVVAGAGVGFRGRRSLCSFSIVCLTGGIDAMERVISHR